MRRPQNKSRTHHLSLPSWQKRTREEERERKFFFKPIPRDESVLLFLLYSIRFSLETSSRNDVQLRFNGQKQGNSLSTFTKASDAFLKK